MATATNCKYIRLLRCLKGIPLVPRPTDGAGINMRSGMGPMASVLKIAGLTAKDRHNTQILCLTPTRSLVKQPHLKQHLKTRIMTLRDQTHTPSAHERLA